MRLYKGWRGAVVDWVFVMLRGMTKSERRAFLAWAVLLLAVWGTIIASLVFPPSP